MVRLVARKERLVHEPGNMSWMKNTASSHMVLE